MAQKYLGHLYQKGFGVERDYDKALKYYKLAAAQGDAEAHEALYQLTGQKNYCGENNDKICKTGSATYDVFLSHASEDQDRIVTPLYDYLTSHGISCFYSPVSIKGGEDYTEIIADAIPRAKNIFPCLYGKGQCVKTGKERGAYC